MWAGLFSCCAPPVYADNPASPQRTEAIFTTPPEGWVLSVWQGGTIELAEFTPPGQTGDGFIDLLGYSVVPKVAGINDTDALFRSSERAKHGCRATRVLDHVGRRGWFESEYLCLGREHAANPDDVEIEFAATTVGKQSVFRVWRSWRGTPAAFTLMLKQRIGRELSPVMFRGGEQEINDRDLKTAFSGLEESFFGDVARSTVCDLAVPSACQPLHQKIPPALAAYVPREPFVAGFIAPGLHRISGEQFRQVFGVQARSDGSPNVVIGALLPGDKEWTDPNEFRRALVAVAYGQAADGGALFLIDRKGEVGPDAQAIALGRVIGAARQLWKVGESPRITVLVVPN